MKRLPNILTVSRLFLAGGFIFFLLHQGLWPMVAATVLFLLASLTDFYDGYYAKKHNLVSNFGKIMDPVADKFLILAAFFVFARMNIIPEWMFYVIFAREFFITGSRFFAMRKGKYLAAERAGKFKTVCQIFTISVILLFLILKEVGLPVPVKVCFSAINVLMLLTVALTLVAGVSYLWNNRKSLNNLS